MVHHLSAFLLSNQNQGYLFCKSVTIVTRVEGVQQDCLQYAFLLIWSKGLGREQIRTAKRLGREGCGTHEKKRLLIHATLNTDQYYFSMSIRKHTIEKMVLSVRSRPKVERTCTELLVAQPIIHFHCNFHSDNHLQNLRFWNGTLRLHFII